MRRTVELTATFVIPIHDDDFVQVMLDALEDHLGEAGFPWFLNRVTQRDGRKIVTDLTYKRPTGIGQ